MKKVHNFDEVFDGQKVFRVILEVMSNPGRILSIKDQIEKIPGEDSALVAIAITLLDNEVSFNTCGDDKLENTISLLSLSKKAELSEADFIFVKNIEELENSIRNGKCGTLLDPHKSASVIVKVLENFDCELGLYGAGIKDTLYEKFPKEVERAIKIRDEQEYEYPQGIDFIFVTEYGRIFSIPRLVLREER